MCIMDSQTPSQVAAMLGVSRRRVAVAADRMGVGATNGKRRLFNEAEVDALRGELGCSTDIASLSRSESLVLAELSRRPLGLLSVRAVARACSLSPTTAAKAVRALISGGLVVEREETLALGSATVVRSLHANVRHPQWGNLLSALRSITGPNRAAPSPESPLPAHLRHAFWNVDNATLRRITPEADGAFLATRALTTDDPQLLAYATATVPASAWRKASQARGLTDEQRVYARNLATKCP
ncbi:MAG: hypothetical protein QG597_431 [Actinomycetota bacterium]|nr:hypothetical protein [Actinomycetota bacterium]